MAWGIKGKVREWLSPILGEGFVLEFSPSKEFGDLSTPQPMIVAKKEGKDPMEVGSLMKERIDFDIFETVTLTRPGYLNFKLKSDFIYRELRSYYQSNFGTKPKSGRVLIEFVSVNPTGPINIVNGRAAALGDVLKRTFNFVGYQAESEYYINDAGRQAELLGLSILARVDQLEGKEFKIPEDGYPGEYLIPVAQKYWELYRKRDLTTARDFGVTEMVKMQKATLSRFNVIFDHWISERFFYREGRVAEVVERLKPYLFEKDGAIWFRADKFGDEKPRVLKTSDGRYTYLVPDLAYHLYKFERGYDLIINIWGPDHHGYISKIKAGLKALGAEVKKLTILIVQQVNLKSRDGKVAMSKRGGKFITLDALLDDIPLDAIRFFFLMRSPSQPLDFDLDLAKERSQKNPVYYVQYAHARICSILRFAKQEGHYGWDDADLGLLNKPEERDLMIELLKFPDIILAVVNKLEPQKLVYYLIDLATTFHHFYERHRVVSEDRAMSRARLYLVDTLRKVISKGLDLLGVSAPQEM